MAIEFQRNKETKIILQMLSHSQPWERTIFPLRSSPNPLFVPETPSQILNAGIGGGKGLTQAFFDWEFVDFRLPYLVSLFDDFYDSNCCEQCGTNCRWKRVYC